MNKVMLIKRLLKKSKKDRIVPQGHLKTILYLHRDESSESIKEIYHNKWGKHYKLQPCTTVPTTQPQWWLKELQKESLNYINLCNELKNLFYESQEYFNLQTSSLISTIKFRDRRLKELIAKLQNSLKKYCQIYLKLNKQKNDNFIFTSKEINPKNIIYILPINSYIHLNSNYPVLPLLNKHWTTLFIWKYKFSRILANVVKTAKNTLQHPNKISSDSKHKYSKFLLCKKKCYKLSIALHKLKWIRRYYNIEQKYNIPRSKRITSTTTVFEHTYNWRRDVSFHSYWFAKFINQFLKRGNKQFAEKTVYNVFKTLKFKFNKDAFIIFWKLLTKIKPLVTTVPKRVGKLYHSIPIPVKFSRGYRIGLKWLLKGIKSQRDTRLQRRILQEILSTIDIYRSFTIKQRDALYYLAAENRTYSHYRWV